MCESVGKHLLGEITVPVASVSSGAAGLLAGEHLHVELQRQSGAAQVRLETDRGEFLGYVAHPAASWIVRLMDADQVHFEAYAADGLSPTTGEPRTVQLITWLTPQGRKLLQKPTVESLADAWHRLICQLYVDCQSYDDPAIVRAIHQRLQSLRDEPLLPESHLLLALLPGIARELEVARPYLSANRPQENSSHGRLRS